MNHIISSQQFDRESIDTLLQLTTHIQQNPLDYQDALQHRIIATLFYEPSTRTRLSFEAATHRLGGRVIGSENANQASSATKGESLEDTIRVISGYADAIVIRHPDNDAAERVAPLSSVPIINAGGGSGEHPTQSLLDLYTIYSHKNRLHHLTIAIMGDLRFGRTIHSLVQMLSFYEQVTIYGLAAPGLELPEFYQDRLKEQNQVYIPCQTINEIPSEVDVIYQTRVQKERIAETHSVDRVIQIDQRTLNRFHADTLLLHPLPRNQEIAPEVDHDPRALYFQQAHHGMVVRMALLYDLLYTDSIAP